MKRQRSVWLSTQTVTPKAGTRPPLRQNICRIRHGTRQGTSTLYVTENTMQSLNIQGVWCKGLGSVAGVHLFALCGARVSLRLMVQGVRSRVRCVGEKLPWRKAGLLKSSR